MFTKANEFQVATSAGIGLNVRAAYSLSEHVGITATYLNANNRALNKNLDATQWGRHNAGEIGIGYFKNTERNAHMDIFAGAGFGKGTAHNTIGYRPLFIWNGDDSYNHDRYNAEAFYYKITCSPRLVGEKKSFPGMPACGLRTSALLMQPLA